MKRNLVGAVILSFLTFGIYGIYWFVKLTNETNELTNSEYASGGLAFFLTIITFGIYGIYWAYAMGKKVNKMENSDNNEVLYLILTIFGVGLIVYILAQKAINNAVEGKQ